ncbi:hypothetical protein B0T25DRAFT_231181 [Lasiosphaeria hispida]|uniref:Extracellular membrane protein CFEM domain-containing protein n=1 Tax=Lasiosphaeria hispida TaxID=260671 RepID=A0AAJ0HDM1_9PEZI|nr:hypothetical protein B0T25DRAFT_231181 [Lasiosphaeria hispida]
MLFLLTTLLLPTTLACKTGTPASPSGSSYPACALSCLFCPDADYTHNFANNCAYTAGECCAPSQHLTISETFTCVLGACNSTAAAQNAFDTFQSFCHARNTSLSAKDVPAGYTSNSTLLSQSDTESGDGGGGGGGLPTRTKIILATTLPSAFLISVLVWIAWRVVQHGRDQDEAKSDDGSSYADETDAEHEARGVHELDAVGAAPPQGATDTRRESGCFRQSGEGS